MRAFPVRLARFALTIAIPAAAALGQSRTEIIRGRILGPDSVPVAQAEVMVTGLATQMVQSTRTDAKGAYTVLFTNGEGEYIVAVRKIGLASTAFRLSRTGMSNVLGSDVYLRSAVVRLDTVAVSATRMGPNRDRAAIGEVGSGSLIDSLFLVDPAKLMDFILSLPGIYTTDSGFSVMGAGADQNMSTIDGMRGRGGGPPPDAIATTRVVTSSADPAMGGAGANTAMTLRGGTDIFSATIRGSNSNRALVWSDPNWASPLARTFSGSGTVNGPIKKGKARYNVSWSGSDRATDWYTLLSPRASLLSQQGISLDTVAAVTRALSGLGVPLSLPTIPNGGVSRSGSISEVVDYTPNATTSIRLSHYGDWTNSSGNTSSGTAFPTSTNRSGYSSHGAALTVSGYVRGLLNETSINLSSFSDYLRPFTTLPGASVRVGTDFSDGRTSFASLAFGGGSGEYYSTERGSYISNELSWLPKDGKHKLKVGGSFNFMQSKYYYFPGSPLLGRYTYLTLDDLENNRPASYDRVLSTSERNTKSATSAAWFGDEWLFSPAIQFQTGLRFDFANPISKPAYNPAVDSVFGLQTNHVPNAVGVSPRLGFSWSSKARRGQGSPGGSASFGGMPAERMAMMPPELLMSLMNVQRSSTLPGIGISGTLGGYRSYVSAIGEYVEATGLGSRVTLSCVGPAVPIPDWDTMTEGPSTCADGTGGSTFSIARPLVRVFDPSYRPALSWRGNVAVDGIRVPGKWLARLGVNYAYNMNGQSTIDRNLNSTPRFYLTGEGNRPVFVDASAVVPASGTISPAASRVSSQFATVSTALSDLEGYNASLTASLAPPRPVIRNRVTLTFGYTLTKAAAQSRGTPRVGITGSPFEKFWVPVSTPLHSFRMSGSGRVWWFNFNSSASLVSGIPFTPMVSGDINGDGNAGNDRAFIPDPGSVADTSLARQLTDLLSHAPGAARRCLSSQLGQMAAANHCRMPWQARVDISASVTPPSTWNYSDRFQLTMVMMNASGALVRALHLENTPLGQSTVSTTPIPTLLYVTGFDPAAQRYQYRVNQAFGQPTSVGSLRRKFAPLQFQVGMQYKFGGPPINPIARGLGLREAVGEAPLTDDQRRAAVARLKTDPVAPVLRLRESLVLSAAQVAQLEELRQQFNAHADSTLTPLTTWVLKKGRRIFDSDLSLKLSPARSALAKLSADYGKRAQAVLSPGQLALFNDQGAKKEK